MLEYEKVRADTEWIECYDANEFKTNHYKLWWLVHKILNGIPGDWEFSHYIVKVPKELEMHFLCFNDENDEDRTFNMAWDNEEMPFAKAHIEVASD